MGKFILGFIIGCFSTFIILILLRISSYSDREEENRQQIKK